MGFDANIESAINRLYDTLKLLHETIRAQTKATIKQSKIMIRLTCAILVFTVVLVVVAVIQIIFIQYHDKLPRAEQKQNYHQQIPTESKLILERQVFPPPPIKKGVNDGKHK